MGRPLVVDLKRLLDAKHGIAFQERIVARVEFGDDFPMPWRRYLEVDMRRPEDIPLHPTQLVGSMTALDTMFRKFINAGAHMIPVEKDDEIIGIATIEDLLEEIIGHEIEDETDRHRRLAQ